VWESQHRTRRTVADGFSEARLNARPLFLTGNICSGCWSSVHYQLLMARNSYYSGEIEHLIRSQLGNRMEVEFPSFPQTLSASFSRALNPFATAGGIQPSPPQPRCVFLCFCRYLRPCYAQSRALPYDGFDDNHVTKVDS